MVTSGGYSPCLKKGVGMCYVPPHLMKAGTELSVEVRTAKRTAAPRPLPCRHPRYLIRLHPPLPTTPRYLPPQVRGKKQPLTVTKMPFVPSNYYRGP